MWSIVGWAWASNVKQHRLANFNNFITSLHHTGNARLKLPGIMSSLLQTSIDPEHIAWIVMHSSYTNRRPVKKSIRMTTIPHCQLFNYQPPSAFCKYSQVCLHNFQHLYSERSCSRYISQVSLLAIFAPCWFPVVHDYWGCHSSRHGSYHDRQHVCNTLRGTGKCAVEIEYLSKCPLPTSDSSEVVCKKRGGVLSRAYFKGVARIYWVRRQYLTMREVCGENIAN